jgi:hypothetical protein
MKRHTFRPRLETLERRDTPSAVISTPDHTHAASTAVVVGGARIGPIIDVVQVVAGAQAMPGGPAPARIVVPVIMDAAQPPMASPP